MTRRRLLAAGITAGEIRVRIARGSLIVVHPGVYRVGHAAPSVEATYMAAVLACGKGAVLMGLAAAWLYGLIKGDPPPPVVRTPTGRRIEGIETHRTRSRELGTEWRGIPITTVPRTLMDLAPSMTEKNLAAACHHAQVRFGVRPQQTSGRARKVLAGHLPVTLSALEDRFLERLHEHALPIPRTNRRTKGRTYVDCRWPAHHLTVELDSYRFHNSRRAFEEDRRREREAYARGDEHRRYTYGDVFEDPELMLAELHELLA
ncbi:MAG TPA: hypothetical protein VFL73_09525 [Solirubrobacteraceae bacterium]|nr:hypothetical protein [Solirubrobacteraceae bacterium]